MKRKVGLFLIITGTILLGFDAYGFFYSLTWAELYLPDGFLNVHFVAQPRLVLCLISLGVFIWLQITSTRFWQAISIFIGIVFVVLAWKYNIGFPIVVRPPFVRFEGILHNGVMPSCQSIIDTTDQLLCVQYQKNATIGYDWLYGDLPLPWLAELMIVIGLLLCLISPRKRKSEHARDERPRERNNERTRERRPSRRT